LVYTEEICIGKVHKIIGGYYYQEERSGINSNQALNMFLWE